MLPDRIRIDRGTETGIMATIHSYLRSKRADLENILLPVSFMVHQHKIRLRGGGGNYLSAWRGFLKTSYLTWQKTETMTQVMTLTGNYDDHHNVIFKPEPEI